MRRRRNWRPTTKIAAIQQRHHVFRLDPTKLVRNFSHFLMPPFLSLEEESCPISLSVGQKAHATKCASEKERLCKLVDQIRNITQVSCDERVARKTLEGWHKVWRAAPVERRTWELFGLFSIRAFLFCFAHLFLKIRMSRQEKGCENDARLWLAAGLRTFRSRKHRWPRLRCLHAGWLFPNISRAMEREVCGRVFVQIRSEGRAVSFDELLQIARDQCDNLRHLDAAEYADVKRQLARFRGSRAWAVGWKSR